MNNLKKVKCICYRANNQTGALARIASAPEKSVGKRKVFISGSQHLAEREREVF